MGFRKLNHPDSKYENEHVIIRYLKSRGYNIESVNPNKTAIDKGLYASIFLIDDKKILRLINKDTGFGDESLSLDGELDKYKKLIGDDNKHIVKVYFAEYLKSTDSYIYVLEKLEKVWKDLNIEFSEWYKYIFSYKQIHNKIKYIPNENQLNTIFEKIYNGDYDAKLKSVSNLNDEEQQIIIDTFKGTKELREKYNIEITDLHIGNLMKAKNGNYKIIDFGI